MQIPQQKTEKPLKEGNTFIGLDEARPLEGRTRMMDS